MKKFIIMILFAGLFVTASSVWALNDNPQDKTTAKVENADKKATGEKACCADKKDMAKASEAKACCADKKETAKASETKACCADKKETAEASETKACCADKKEAANSSACANKAATAEAKSSGKKAN